MSGAHRLVCCLESFGAFTQGGWLALEEWPRGLVDAAHPSYDCNGTPAQQWNLKHETTQVRVVGTDFCLDAGLGESRPNLRT